MKLLDVVREVRRHLEENGRVSLRLLRRQYELDDEALDELIEELIDVQRVARREENVLVWSGAESTGFGVGGYGFTGPNRTITPSPVTSRPLSETRKVISIIFADLMGSTTLQEGLDPESVNRVMDAYYQAVRGPVEAAGGTVVQLLGDGVLCAFGIPRIAEDDALRAVRAAVGIQHAFREFLRAQQWLNVAIGLRVAVNTGEVVVSEEHPAGIGDPLNVAARLQQEARDGEVVIGQATRRLVANDVTLEQAGVFALKGRAETVTAYRVVSLERPTGAITAAFVGRDDELARITAVYDAARATPAARLAVVLGSPGLGKSRLIEEVARRRDDASVVTAQCDAAGGATFAPVAAALRGWLGAARTDPTDPSDPSDPSAALAAVLAESPDRTRIITGITALLAGSPASPEETFFVIRRFLTALAQTKPLVLVIDDLHWAEPLLLDLVEHLIQWGSGVPLFVLVGARPELRELRSSLVTPGGHVADVVTLSGLDAGAAMRLAANVIGAADLPAAVAAKVLATSEGNPLFVGELVRMLVDEGAIERQGDRWVVGANLAVLEMPPTIHALLAARIERLRPEERTVLERASVVGRYFSRSAVAALLSHNGSGSRTVASGEASDLDARLDALQRGELIERDTGWFLGEPVLRFHHVLIRDAAYRRLLKGTRAELHARFAEWVTARAGETDHDETIGWHLEQAHQLLRELGPLDAAGRALGEQAARHLAAAGRRALARDDLPVAADLLGRAINCFDAADAARAELALDWCEALLSAGDVGRAAGAIAELGRFAEDKGLGGSGVTGLGAGSSVTPNPLIPNSLRLSAWHSCFTAQLTVLTAPQELQAAADAAADAAAELAKRDDAAGEAKAHSVRAQALARLGKVGACEAALDQALAAARRAGDRRRANAVLAGAPVAALWGPSPVTRASGRCLDVVRVLRITQGAPAVEAVALSCQGVLEALRGRTEAARRMLASSRKMVEDLGIAQRLFEVDFFDGRIALLEGDGVGAERLLRGAYQGLRDLGLGIDAARAGALLARTLLVQERVDEAEALSHESERLAGDDLQAAIAWRGVRAEALAQRGEHVAAVELAQAAVAIASATDALLDHADARMALAAALHAAGRSREAETEKRRASELWESKGATLLAERVRRAETPTQAKPGATAPRVAASEAPRRGRRRVRINAAEENGVRLAAALAARDISTAERELADSLEIFHHPTGLSYDRAGLMDTFHRLVRAKDLVLRREALATLGHSLALSRQFVAFDATDSQLGPVGAVELETIMLEEVDATGRRSRTAIFAADHLGDAIARLYARYAELLPEGPERERAAVMAHALAYILTDATTPDESLLFDPHYADIDHRNVGYGRLSTGEAQKIVVSQRALADELRFRVEDVLALSPDGLVRKTTTSGVWRDGGGAFERTVCMLSVFGPDGRAARQESFDSDRETEALARFDEIVCAEPARQVRRPVPRNAASAWLDAFATAFAARADAAIDSLLDDRAEAVDHRCHAAYGRDAILKSWRGMMKPQDAEYRMEPIATLGERLSLTRYTYTSSGSATGRFDVGESAADHLKVVEVDASGGKSQHHDLFAIDRLGDAVACLYQRHAALLPEGTKRERAVTTALAVAAMLTRSAEYRLEDFTVSDFEVVDHRTVGTVTGREVVSRWREVSDELMQDQAFRIEDVLALSPDALLRRTVQSGTVRASGGAFETSSLALSVFGPDGRQTRFELFEIGHEAEALARFDEVAAAATTAGRWENRASRAWREVIAACRQRDLERFAALQPRPLRYRDHRRLFQLDLDREGFLEFTRPLLTMRSASATPDLLATRGDRLALMRFTLEMEDEVVGPSAIDSLLLIETDERRAIAAYDRYELDDLDAAYAELDARWAHGAAVAHPAASKWLADYLRFFAARDWSAMSALFAPEVIGENHRLVGWGTRTGPAGIVSTLQAQIELAPETRERVDHVRTCAGALLFEYAWHGTREGGAFENLWIVLIELDADGRARRADVWEGEQLEQAQARFDEMRASGERPSPPITRQA